MRMLKTKQSETKLNALDSVNSSLTRFRHLSKFKLRQVTMYKLGFVSMKYTIYKQQLSVLAFVL